MRPLSSARSFSLKRCLPVRALCALAVAGILGAPFASQPAQAIETSAPFAVMIDGATGDTLFEKGADQRMAPASMSKLMTLALLFESLKTGQYSLEDTFLVSEKAWRKGGSKMFIEVGKQIPVSDLIYGIAVQSGNDACIAVAEGLAGSEAAFAERMNAKAQELGMTGSNFTNASGWPDEDHYMTARDLAILARHIITEYPEFYPFFSVREFTYNDIRQFNRNPLLRLNIGVDGMKTGHTEASGYGLVAAAEREGRRLILVVNGLENEAQRRSEASRLVEVGYRDYQPVDVFAQGDTVDFAPVYLGRDDTVPMVVAEDIRFYMPPHLKDKLEVTPLVEGPITAPIAANQQVATLKLEVPGFETREVPLYAARAVEKAGLGKRLGIGLRELILGSPSAGETPTDG